MEAIGWVIAVGAVALFLWVLTRKRKRMEPDAPGGSGRDPGGDDDPRSPMPPRPER